MKSRESHAATRAARIKKLVRAFHGLLDQEQRLRAEWRKIVQELAVELHAARKYLPSNFAFGEWLTQNDLHGINKNDRQCLIRMGGYPELLGRSLERETRTWSISGFYYGENAEPIRAREKEAERKAMEQRREQERIARAFEESRREGRERAIAQGAEPARSTIRDDPETEQVVVPFGGQRRRVSAPSESAEIVRAESRKPRTGLARDDAPPDGAEIGQVPSEAAAADRLRAELATWNAEPLAAEPSRALADRFRRVADLIREAGLSRSIAAFRDAADGLEIS